MIDQNVTVQDRILKVQSQHIAEAIGYRRPPLVALS